MHCRIADLIVDVPETSDMMMRCLSYIVEEQDHVDIVIDKNQYRAHIWHNFSQEDMNYMESGAQFNKSVINFNGLMLHSSAVEMDDKAYLFSGPSRMGKSTHTRIWQQVFGSAAQVFNDDKPALRYIDGKWFAYGTPWCGKDGINQNKKVPLAGICFLKRGETNFIRQLSTFEAFQKVVSQTRRKFSDPELLDLMLKNVEKLVNMIPVFELQNIPVQEAAQLSYKIMRKKAEEMGL